jgi:potassium efflux system protein
MSYSRQVRVIVYLIAVIVLWLSMPLAYPTEESSQRVTNEKASSGITPTVGENRIKDIEERIKVSEAAENDHTAEQFGVSLLDLQTRTTKLREIKIIYQRLLTALKKQVALDTEEVILRDKKKKQEQVGLPQKPPYPLSFYDYLLDRISAAEQEKETGELERRLRERTLEDTRSRLVKAQKTLRGLKEQLEGAEGVKDSGTFRWDLEQGELELELAHAMLDFQKVRLENLQTQIRLAELKRDIGQESIRWVGAHLHFDEGDLEKQVQVIQKERAELQRRLGTLMREQRQVEEAWLGAQKRISNVRNESERAVASAFLEARQAWRETYQRVLEQTEHLSDLLNQREQAWKRRYELVKGEVSPEQLDIWRKDAETQIRRIDRVVALLQASQTNLQARVAALERQVSEEGVNPEIIQHLQTQMQALRKLSERSLEYLSMLLATNQVNHRLVDEIASRREHIALWEKVLAVRNKAKDVWNFELWVIDDNAVTVRKVTIALFIFVFGLLMVKHFIRLIRNRLLPRMNLEASAAAALEKIVYYVALLLIILFGLRMVNIPLTAFTFLGGAIAIGVGFGAQNLINNFISGFIIMAERPIKIGDLVEIEGNFAKVEEIGARCTRIRTAGNIHILVPNSSFLEKNITNWTLSDKMVRARVTVGVAYGSPVREVKRLMVRAVSDHGSVLKTPAPSVLFSDFGENSLVFHVYFWITVSRIMERWMIESDVRFRINDLFRQAGIVIAFPQRDVHIDTTRPLEFKILNANGPTEEIDNM